MRLQVGTTASVGATTTVVPAGTCAGSTIARASQVGTVIVEVLGRAPSTRRARHQKGHPSTAPVLHRRRNRRTPSGRPRAAAARNPRRMPLKRPAATLGSQAKLI